MTANSTSGCWVMKADLLVAISRSRQHVNSSVWKDYLGLCREFQYQTRGFRPPVRRTTSNLVKLLAENKNMLTRIRREVHNKLDELQNLAKAPAHEQLVFVSLADMDWLQW